MSREMKNVIILKNINSKVFDEVIFVLKGSELNQNRKIDLVYEARRIVENYADKLDNEDNSPIIYNASDEDDRYRSKRLSTILNISLFLSAVIFVLLIISVL